MPIRRRNDGKKESVPVLPQNWSNVLTFTAKEPSELVYFCLEFLKGQRFQIGSYSDTLPFKIALQEVPRCQGTVVVSKAKIERLNLQSLASYDAMYLWIIASRNIQHLSERLRLEAALKTLAYSYSAYINNAGHQFPWEPVRILDRPQKISGYASRNRVVSI